MPFFQPFKTKFSNGDLIYGLTSARQVFANKIFNQFDQTNQFSQRNKFSQFNLPVTIDNYAVTKFEDLIQKHPDIERYKPVPRDQDLFRKAIKTHPRYANILNAGGRVENGWGKHPPKAMSRKCKAGIFWITEKNTDRHIHFILDNINMKCVVNKNHECDITGRSVTGSELRWIYRNKHNPNVINKIQFWHKGIPVLPPWVTSPHLWSEYNRGNDISDVLSMIFNCN
ncbi:MAG: hypothetical protein H6R25_462 [Proteobacteria bacterium]|nr:hypothetical protein [Pseudomonadota bacterium]